MTHPCQLWVDGRLTAGGQAAAPDVSSLRLSPAIAPAFRPVTTDERGHTMPGSVTESAKTLQREDEALWRRFKIAAATEGCTIRDLLRRCLEEYLERYYPT